MNAGGPEEITRDTVDQARMVLEEARMVLPGIQALFGFQLVAALSDRFKQLGHLEQGLHFVALTLVALAIASIMTPAAYHRIAEPGPVSAFFVKLASWLIAIAMAPLMIALCLEIYITARLILDLPWIALGVSLALFIVFAAMWFVFPLAWRKGP